MARDAYAAQVALLVRVLPYVAQERVFALKGGTAINLFYRDLPRLSVDIDLTYLPNNERSEALAEINAAMGRICEGIIKGIGGAHARMISGGGGTETRIQVASKGAAIKIETSPVMRSVVHDPEVRVISERVEAEFGFVEMSVVSFEDLFAGKLHAALDRQHPRDLYDVKRLYEHEGLTDALFRTFLVYIACSGRPAHELLAPNKKNLDQPYAREFEGMTRETVSLEALMETQDRLVSDIQSKLDAPAQRFLLSLYEGDPDFRVIDRESAADLPAVRWKLLNLRKLAENNPDKLAALRADLENIFEA